MEFVVTSLPAELTSTSMISDVDLYIYPYWISSEEGNGVDLDFCVIEELEDIDSTPNDEAEEGDMFHMFEEKCETGGTYDCYYNDCEINMEDLFSYNFDEGVDEDKWMSFDITTDEVKSEIIQNMDSSPDNSLAIGIHGEYDTNDDEMVDIRGEDDTGTSPYIRIVYSTNVAPTWTSMTLSSPYYRKAGTSITASANGETDSNGDALYMYCTESGTPSSSNYGFGSDYDSGSPYYLDAYGTVSATGGLHTVSCRLYDSQAYSSTKSDTY